MLLGTYQMLFYGALLIVVMAMRQWEFIGLGSIANMVLVGYSKDLFDVIFSSMNILNRDAMGMTERICWLVPTLGVFMVAVAFYMVVELGSGSSSKHRAENITFDTIHGVQLHKSLRVNPIHQSVLRCRNGSIARR